MKRARLRDLTVSQLAERFAAIALEQDEALLMDEIAKVNRLFYKLEAIEEELKAALSVSSIEQLVERFAAICLEQLILGLKLRYG